MTKDEYHKQYNKQYVETNKEFLREKAKEKSDCECAGKYTYAHKARHFRSKKHIRHLESAAK